LTAVEAGGMLGLAGRQPTCHDRARWRRSAGPAGRHMTSILRYLIAAALLSGFSATASSGPLSLVDETQVMSSTGGPCFFPWWHHEQGECDARISPGDTARVILTVQTAVSIAGLQGRLVVSPPGLRIASLEPTVPFDPSSSIRLTWTPSSDGARFVMFSKGGTPIAPGGTRAQVLRVGLVAGDRPIPDRTLVTTSEFLASDEEGRQVPICPIDVFDAAYVCRGVSCDANGDGRTDIRDIVLLARCLRHGPACSLHVDCNGDGGFDLEDVLCCARRILGIRPCNDCPPDTTRPLEGASLRFGPPRRTGDGIDVPLVLNREDALGGVRLDIAYPSDVFSGSNLVLTPVAGWLDVAQASPGVLSLGLIRIADLAYVDLPGPLELTLHLTLAPGREPEGTIDLSAEFSALDGALIEVPFDTTLPLGADLAITEPRPNPFSAETRFTVTLPRSGQVAVTVHDLAGRRVATLFDGVHEAGVLATGWNGRADRGGVAGNGIYFVRVRAAGATASTKLIRMGAR
jgi:hypothetical protein